MNDFMEDFCPYCKRHHRPEQKLLCAFNRAINKVWILIFFPLVLFIMVLVLLFPPNEGE